MALKLLPSLATKAPARANQLNQMFSGYVAILLWNQDQAPVALEPEPASRRVKRVHVPCSMRRSVRALARKLAKKHEMSVNALVECLIARDLRSSDPGLTILPARTLSRPRL